jgi:hypothetical protein
MKAFWKRSIRIGLAVGALLGTHACNAEADIRKPVAMDAKRLALANILVNGSLAAAYRISDRDGEHILVLSRKSGSSPSAPKSGRIERVDLVAEYYQRIAGQWKQEWTIRDSSDCPGLDVAGEFFLPQVGFTDLNNDGKAEVTVPYRLFCGGGVEPSTVKVILRDGPVKLAIRGESLVQVQHPGVEAFGGEHKHDAALLTPDSAPYKRHLDAVWAKVSVEKR